MAICPHCQEPVDDRFHVLLDRKPDPLSQCVKEQWRCDRARILEHRKPIDQAAASAGMRGGR